jgi:threonine dehydrogenase-like Zn-dependent dehydrogenase
MLTLAMAKYGYSKEESLMVGDRVYTDNFVTCGKCEACLKGDFMSCPSIWSVGTVNCWDGCYAEYMQMPERHVFHLPDNLSMDEGALIEPASIAYDAFRGVTLTKDDTAVVYGTGAIGMVAVWLAKYYGAGEVILVGRSDEKLAVGLAVGADHVINGKTEDAVARIKELSLRKKGADLVVETSGSASALRDSIACTARYGRISVVSFYERNLDDLPIDPLVLGCMSMVGAAGRYRGLEFLASSDNLCLRRDLGLLTERFDLSLDRFRFHQRRLLGGIGLPATDEPAQNEAYESACEYEQQGYDESGGIRELVPDVARKRKEGGMERHGLADLLQPDFC